MSRITNLTPEILRRIINEEKKKVVKEKAKKKAKISGKPQEVSKAAKQTREVQASEMAHTLAKEVEHYKELKNEAAYHAQQLSEINEAVQEIRSRIIEQL